MRPNNNLIINSKPSDVNNTYLTIYINKFIKKFRSYNQDKFLITISGLKSFINNDNEVVTSLLDNLKENGFLIKFIRNSPNVNSLHINCNNITNNIKFKFKYQIQCLPTIIEISTKTDIPTVGILIMKIVAHIISKLQILYKAIILDLDETLWKGTISEDGIEKITENLYSEQGRPFIEFMNFVISLSNELGLYIAICSRNDIKIIESLINELDSEIFPLKNHIDCIVANNNDKSKNIKKISEELSILSSSIVFIDDNQLIRDEVKSELEEVFVPEWNSHNELVTQLIVGCIFERHELSLASQNRRKQYKIIQTARLQNYLPKLLVRAIIDKNHIESIKLYSKSNQFKFSEKHDNFNDTESIYFEIFREDNENLGICSTISYTLKNTYLYIHNWAISCRFFEIGLEEFILLYLLKRFDINYIIFNYQNSEKNKKVEELIDKYPNTFKNIYKEDRTELIFRQDITENFNDNTNLGMIENEKA